MLKKLKLLKKPIFQKRRWSCDFPPRKMPVALKRRAISPQEKMAFSAPVGLSWDSPPPPTECADGRTYGCTDVRTDGHVTITSQPKFLGLKGYHISLAMELRWRALPAGSAIRLLIATFYSLYFQLKFSAFKMKITIQKTNKTKGKKEKKELFKNYALYSSEI